MGPSGVYRPVVGFGVPSASRPAAGEHSLAMGSCSRRSLRLVSLRRARSAVGDAVDATPWELPPGGGFGPVVIVLLVHPVLDGDGDDYPSGLRLSR